MKITITPLAVAEELNFALTKPLKETQIRCKVEIERENGRSEYVGSMMLAYARDDVIDAHAQPMIVDTDE